MADMFLSMSKTACPLEQAHLCLVRSRTVYGDILLRLVSVETPVGELLSRVMGRLGQKCSALVDRADLDAAVFKAASRDAEFTKYAESIDVKLFEAVRTIGASSEAWVD